MRGCKSAFQMILLAQPVMQRFPCRGSWGEWLWEHCQSLFQMESIFYCGKPMMTVKQRSLTKWAFCQDSTSSKDDFFASLIPGFPEAQRQGLHSLLLWVCSDCCFSSVSRQLILQGKGSVDIPDFWEIAKEAHQDKLCRCTKFLHADAIAFRCVSHCMLDHRSKMHGTSLWKSFLFLWPHYYL